MGELGELVVKDSMKGYCCHELTNNDKVAVRVGKNVDPLIRRFGDTLLRAVARRLYGQRWLFFLKTLRVEAKRAAVLVHRTRHVFRNTRRDLRLNL